MRCLTYFARVLGICVLCLGAIAFMGCSGSGNSLGSTVTPPGTDNTAGNTGGNDNTSTQASTTGFQVIIPGPTFPTKQDYMLAQAKPDKDDAFATLAPFSIDALCGRIIKASGEKELETCFFGDDHTDGVTLLEKKKNNNESPLSTASDFSSVKSLLPIIFPEGRNLIGLSDDSDLDLGQFNGTLTNPLFNTKIKKLCLIFDVFDCFGEPQWTLPTCVSFTSQMANGKSIINGSKLALTWKPEKGSIPPHGRAFVVGIFKFCNNGKEILCIKKAVPIVGNTATFCADNTDCDDPTLKFDKVDVCFDLTCTVPFVGEDHNQTAS